MSGAGAFKRWTVPVLLPPTAPQLLAALKGSAVGVVVAENPAAGGGGRTSHLGATFFTVSIEKGVPPAAVDVTDTVDVGFDGAPGLHTTVTAAGETVRAEAVAVTVVVTGTETSAAPFAVNANVDLPVTLPAQPGAIVRVYARLEMDELRAVLLDGGVTETPDGALPTLIATGAEVAVNGVTDLTVTCTEGPGPVAVLQVRVMELGETLSRFAPCIVLARTTGAVNARAVLSNFLFNSESCILLRFMKASGRPRWT